MWLHLRGNLPERADFPFWTVPPQRKEARMKPTLNKEIPPDTPGSEEAQKALRKHQTTDQEIKEFLRKTAYKEPLPFDMQKAIAWLEAKYGVQCPSVEILKVILVPDRSLPDNPTVLCHGICSFAKGGSSPKIQIQKIAPPKTLFHEYHHWLELYRNLSTQQSEAEIDQRAVDDYQEFLYGKTARQWREFQKFRGQGS